MAHFQHILTYFTQKERDSRLLVTVNYPSLGAVVRIEALELREFSDVKAR